MSEAKKGRPKIHPAPFAEYRAGLLEPVQRVRFDPYTLIFAWGSYMIETARAMREKYAISYRGFRVGDTNIGFNPRTYNAVAYRGANYKPSRSPDKLCAEMVAVEDAKLQGYRNTIAAFVVGTSDRAEILAVNHVAAPTLWPCEPCASEYLDPSTVVVSIAHDKDVYQVQVNKQIQYVYENPRLHEPNSIVFDNPEFTLFAIAGNIYHAKSMGIPPEHKPENHMQRAEIVVNSFLEAANHYN